MELLSDKAEDLCGYKPDLELCSKFLFSIAGKSLSSSLTPESIPYAGKVTSPYEKKRKSRTKSQYSFKFNRKTYNAASARDVMIQLFQLLAAEDKTFLERFASRKHGKKRRYIAQEKNELYPGPLDLSEEHSVEIVSGWWIGTNYSRSNIQQIIDLALEVAKPNLRKNIQVSVL